jgi:hypothetical protein
MLLLEESQRVIQRLENDPQLLEPIRITPTDPINIGEELNGSEQGMILRMEIYFKM